MRSIRLEFLLELVSDAYLTANRTRYMWSSTQETTPLDHASPTTSRSQAAGNDSRLCRARNTQNPLCGKTKAAPHDRDLPTSVKHRAYTPRAWRKSGAFHF